MTKQTKRPTNIANCPKCGGAFLKLDLILNGGVCPSDRLIAEKASKA